MIIKHYPFDMSHIQWIAVSAIGTQIAAISSIIITVLSLKTVRELQTEREQSLKPDLVLEGENYSFLVRIRNTMNFVIGQEVKEKLSM